MSVHEGQSVRELAVRIPGATRVFEEWRIDYCCGGARSLREACEAQGAALPRVVAELRAAEEQGRPAEDRDWGNAPLSKLMKHIVERHHTYTREELDRLKPLAEKVSRAHKKTHPELLLVRDEVASMDDELRSHMKKEELILFPYIEELEAAVRAGRAPKLAPFGMVENPVRMMMVDHDHTDRELRAMRSVTNDFSLPAESCAPWRALYAGLSALERDLHEHMHLESNVLFPRAIALEGAERAGSRVRHHR